MYKYSFDFVIIDSTKLGPPETQRFPPRLALHLLENFYYIRHVENVLHL